MRSTSLERRRHLTEFELAATSAPPRRRSAIAATVQGKLPDGVEAPCSSRSSRYRRAARRRLQHGTADPGGLLRYAEDRRRRSSGSTASAARDVGEAASARCMRALLDALRTYELTADDVVRASRRRTSRSCWPRRPRRPGARGARTRAPASPRELAALGDRHARPRRRCASAIAVRRLADGFAQRSGRSPRLFARHIAVVRASSRHRQHRMSTRCGILRRCGRRPGRTRWRCRQLGIRASIDSVVDLVLGAVLAIASALPCATAARDADWRARAADLDGTFAFVKSKASSRRMTTLALSSSVGILIDDAIVVRENIMRHLHMGKNRQAALDRGTQRNRTGRARHDAASIVAVFLPVAFMDGIPGRLLPAVRRYRVELPPYRRCLCAFPRSTPIALSKRLGVRSGSRRTPGAAAAPDRAVSWQNSTCCLRASRSVYRGALTASPPPAGLRSAPHWRLFVGSFFFPFVGAEFQAAGGDNGELAVAVETASRGFFSLEYTRRQGPPVEAALSQLPEVSRTYAHHQLSARSTGENKASVSRLPWCRRAERRTGLRGT